MKRTVILSCAALGAFLSASAAVPLRWTVETSRLQPAVFDAVRGEKLALEASFQSYGKPLEMSLKPCSVFWQTNGMGSAWWMAPATVASNRVSAAFTPEMDPGAAVVNGFIGSTGENYRAAFTLRFRPGPGAVPNALPLPTPVIDCAKVTFLNPSAAPWDIGGGGGGGGVDTNAVFGIIHDAVATNYLCTVAAAKAKADAAEAAAKAASLPLEWGGNYASIAVATIMNAQNAQYASQAGQSSISGFSDKAASIVYKVDALEITVAKGYSTGPGYRLVSGNYTGPGSESEYEGVFAFEHNIPTPEDNAFKAAFASKATESTVAAWEGYWRGDRIRISVTNYYGNTSGEPPRLRIEEFDHSVTNGGVVSNFYRVVWDEMTRQTSYYARVESQMGTLSNRVLSAAWQQTNLQLANKAPRAWQSVTSAGEDAPPNTVWHTAPSTVFAGGTEYAHVAVGEGQICVLVDKGAPVFTEGAEGQFRFCDETRNNYFGFDVRSSYTLGCRTDGIAVDHSTHIISLTYDLTSASPPSIMHSTNLVDWVDVEATWEQNPPPGAQICYFDAGAVPHGFFKAEMRYAGGSKFLTNMMADMMGGIAATNETGVSTATQLPIYPAITPTGVVWRVMQ